MAVVWILTGPLRSLYLRSSGPTTFYPVDLVRLIVEHPFTWRPVHRKEFLSARWTCSSVKGGAGQRPDQSDSECDCRDLQRRDKYPVAQEVHWNARQGNTVRQNKNEATTTNRATLGSQCWHRGGKVVEAKYRGKIGPRNRNQLGLKGWKLHKWSGAYPVTRTRSCGSCGKWMQLLTDVNTPFNRSAAIPWAWKSIVNLKIPDVFAGWNLISMEAKDKLWYIKLRTLMIMMMMITYCLHAEFETASQFG